jgi:hypothetical protein
MTIRKSRLRVRAVLFDGTEIDEILSLRILTMTDDEKQEMRQSDERAGRFWSGQRTCRRSNS